MKKVAWLVLAGCVLGLAYAQIQRVVSVQLASQKLQLESVEINGKTFVSLEQIQKAFPPTPSASTTPRPANAVPGGTNQVTAAEGCVNEFLFNGAWRFRVLSVKYDTSKEGWAVRVELRNGMKKVARVVGSGADSNARDISLALNSGNTVSLTIGQMSKIQTAMLFNELAPAAAAITEMIFYAPATDQAKKFLWLQSATNNIDKAPLMKDPAFRINLTCTKP